MYVAFEYYRGSLFSDFYVSKVNNNLNRYAYSTIFKQKDVRPRIDIYVTDTEEEIFLMLCNAWYTEDCDVHFEHGNYSFDSIFGLMKSKYEWNTAYELPIGGNCRYFFNGSTLTALYTGSDSNVAGNASLLGSNRKPGNYELFDGTLIANNIIYVVHDEAGASPKAYTRKYHNLTMKYIAGDNSRYLSKCIGGGTGLFGNVEIDNCRFFSERTSSAIANMREASYHGCTESDAESNITVTVKNCWFDNCFSIENLGANQTAECFYSGNSAKANPSKAGWDVYAFANEVRNN